MCFAVTYRSPYTRTIVDINLSTMVEMNLKEPNKTVSFLSSKHDCMEF